MAAPATIGFDATGRSNTRVEVIEEDREAGARRVRKRHDLFAYEAREELKDGRWEEVGRHPPLAGEGVLGAWARFRERPADFFA